MLSHPQAGTLGSLFFQCCFTSSPVHIHLFLLSGYRAPPTGVFLLCPRGWFSSAGPRSFSCGAAAVSTSLCVTQVLNGTGPSLGPRRQLPAPLLQ